ncbi:MAG: sodium-dependent bicarbonate transport family permease [Leptospiraceae bacterium]|nr:sodium-dependent bicarbonate transport family permease [Leptospiraceae bacterium]
MPDIVVMFFVLGLIAGIVRSDLEIPKAAYDVLSLLLMLTIGLKGGMALYGNLNWGLVGELVGVMLLGFIIPLLLFPILRYIVGLSLADSSSIAAHYGSVSAGTFAVALAYVETNGLKYNPEVTLYLVMLELPAIIVGLLLYRFFSKTSKVSTGKLWHEAFTNRGVILLLGGVIIGMMYGPQNGSPVTSQFTGAFKAVLALFLLEMGLTAAETLRPFPWKKWRLLVFALGIPPILGFFGLVVAHLLALNMGTSIILASLTASASYIAAPAAIKSSIKEANIGLAMLASLGLTFPFNVIVGIGLYHSWGKMF